MVEWDCENEWVFGVWGANFACEGAIGGGSADNAYSLISTRLLIASFAYAAGGYFFSAAKKSNQKTPFKGSPLKI